MRLMMALHSAFHAVVRSAEVVGNLGILNLESWVSRSFFLSLESWILNLESYPLGFKNSFWESWILGFKNFFLSLESWILNLESYTPLDSRILSGNLESWILGFKKFFQSLESWILNPTPLDLGKNAFWMHSLQNPRSKIPTRFANNCNYWSPENALNCRVQNIKENTVNTTKFAWNWGGTIYIYL